MTARQVPLLRTQSKNSINSRKGVLIKQNFDLDLEDPIPTPPLSQKYISRKKTNLAECDSYNLALGYIQESLHKLPNCQSRATDDMFTINLEDIR